MNTVLGSLLFFVCLKTIVKASDEDEKTNSTQSERFMEGFQMSNTGFDDFPPMGLGSDSPNLPPMGLGSDFPNFPPMGGDSGFPPFPPMGEDSGFPPFPPIDEDSGFPPFPPMGENSDFPPFPPMGENSGFPPFPPMGEFPGDMMPELSHMGLGMEIPGDMMSDLLNMGEGMGIPEDILPDLFNMGESIGIPEDMMFELLNMGQGLEFPGDMMHVLPAMAQNSFPDIFNGPMPYPDGCDCPCMYDDNYDGHYDSWDYYDGHYDSWDYYDYYDSWEYYGDHGKMDHLNIFKEIGYFLPNISSEISHIRPIIHDIRMMISEWDSLSALEDLISSLHSGKMSLQDILPRNFNYSIVGDEILRIMDEVEVEQILDVAEKFFRSKEFGAFAFHLMICDGSTSMVDYVVEGLQKSELIQSHMRHFDSITWIRKFEMSLSKLPWLHVLILGLGDILQIQPFIEEIMNAPSHIETERFGGCSEASVIRRCADETFASQQTVETLLTIIGGAKSASGMGKDTDSGVLMLMGCILSDEMCSDQRPPSVEKLANIIRPQFENPNSLTCYKDKKSMCENEDDSTATYISCYQGMCE